MKKIILPSITSNYDADWKSQINEIREFKLTKVALFLSAFDSDKRQECYQKLEQLLKLTIPFIHARSDMPIEEYEYLISRFGTKKFNLHPEREFPLQFKLKEMKQNIYIENIEDLYEKDLLGFAGICLDISHQENNRLLDQNSFKQVSSLLKKYPIGVNHLSAISTTLRQYKDGSMGYEDHHMTSFDQFNYLKKYPAKFFAEYMAIELDNPISEQLLLISYLKQILKFL